MASNNALLSSLLTGGKYASSQDAINEYNKQTFGSDSGGKARLDKGDAGYGVSPALYNAGGKEQIGLPESYLVKQPDGSWQTIQRTKPAPAAPMFGAAGPTMFGTQPVGTVGTQMSPNSTGGGLINTAVPNPASLNVNSQDQQAAINQILSKRVS